MEKIKKIIFILLIVSFFLQFARIDLWDHDFWWHIATGRHIVSTGQLLNEDIFSYTSSANENTNLYPERENFILKQYWLAQAIFYGIHNYAGVKGIIILRALLYAMTVMVVIWRLHRWGVSTPITFISGFALFMLMLSRLTGDRPVLFTIFFTALVFFVLEDFKEKKDRRIYLLVPLMLLWANLHGGFIIGVVLIAVIMLGEGLKIIFKKAEYTRHEIFIFYAASILAIGFSFVNPTGWDAFDIAFSSKYNLFTEGIQEYLSPFKAYKEQIASMNYWFIAYVFLFPVVLIIRNKKMDLSHSILLAGLFTASISAIRFEDYYGIIAAMIIGKEIDTVLKDLLKIRFSERTYSKILNGLTVVSLISAAFYMTSDSLFKKPNFTVAQVFSVPVRGVDFIEKNKLEGNIFNDYGYGGYITWRLYPWKKTFVDTRGLNLVVMSEYGWIVKARDSIYNDTPSSTKGPLWERLLKHYDINVIFLSLFDVYNELTPVVLKLSENDKWVPVFCDRISIIFVRNTEQNQDVIKKFKLSKEYVYNVIVYQGAALATANPVNPRSLKSLGKIFYETGRLEDALTAYRYAMNRLPSPLLQEEIDKIEAELKAKDNKKKT